MDDLTIKITPIINEVYIALYKLQSATEMDLPKDCILSLINTVKQNVDQANSILDTRINYNYVVTKMNNI